MLASFFKNPLYAAHDLRNYLFFCNIFTFVDERKFFILPFLAGYLATLISGWRLHVCLAAIIMMIIGAGAGGPQSDGA